MSRFAIRIVASLQAMSLYRRLVRHLAGPVLIREMGEAEFRQILALAKITPGRSGSNWKDYVTDLVALRQGTPVGYVQLLHFPEDAPLYPGWWIFNLWVHPLWRGAGIGAQLSRAALTLFEQQEGHTIRLLVHQDNRRAIRLYQQLGFTINPVNNPRWGKDMLMMVRELLS
jgi:ribosomal protein S18 acetylase RimI-like enzyme